MVSNIEEAMEYIKGYCNKHIDCTYKGISCRLYDDQRKKCLAFGDIPPCDWEIYSSEEEKS